MSDDREVILKLLSEEPIEVLQTAFLYSKNYIDYGVNVVEQWQTATQQSANLQRAYMKGYKEALEKPMNEAKRREYGMLNHD